jgi:hypothetical protein
MAKFLIEVPHDATEQACVAAVKIFYETGSHFLANADWGCHDGDHKAWMLVDVDTKDQARTIVTAAFRSEAKITELHRFTKEEIEEYKYH